MAAKKKLSTTQVNQIRTARTKGESQASLAERHQVHISTIRAAERGAGAYATL